MRASLLSFLVLLAAHSASAAAVFRVHVIAPPGTWIAIRGETIETHDSGQPSPEPPATAEGRELSWDAPNPPRARKIDEDIWEARIEGNANIKFLLVSDHGEQWMSDRSPQNPNLEVHAAGRERAYDYFPNFGPPMVPASAPRGRIVEVPDFYSPQFDNHRTLRIYLPPGYDDPPLQGQPERRYPVAVFQDGHNLFGKREESWMLDLVMDRLIAEGKAPPAILVGIDQTDKRMEEYGLGADRYADFVAHNVLRDYVTTHFRTLVGPGSTGIMGSSMGGRAAVVARLIYPEIFGYADSFSGSMFHETHQLEKLVRSYRGPRSGFYFDSGTDGVGEDNRGPNLRFRELFLQYGWQEGADFQHLQAAYGVHTEANWSLRVAERLYRRLSENGCNEKLHRRK